MECPRCGKNEAREIMTTKTIKDSKTGEYLIIDNIPMITCQSCGESLYSLDAMKKIDEVRKHPEKAIITTAKLATL